MIEAAEFNEFPKMSRLRRDAVISEKIDGTNGQVYIRPAPEDYNPDDPANVGIWLRDGMLIRAGSRTQWVAPGKNTDNHGFALWVLEHAQELVKLGPGRHFGEWWGSGIQRGYGLPKGEKRWSLFSVLRWCKAGETPQRIPTADPRIEKYQEVLPGCCHLVPVLHRGMFSTEACGTALERLRTLGSEASPGFMKPEGIVVFHTVGNVGFKQTLEKDDVPKSKAN